MILLLYYLGGPWGNEMLKYVSSKPDSPASSYLSTDLIGQFSWALTSNSLRRRLPFLLLFTLLVNTQSQRLPLLSEASQFIRQRDPSAALFEGISHFSALATVFLEGFFFKTLFLSATSFLLQLTPNLSATLRMQHIVIFFARRGHILLISTSTTLTQMGAS